MKNVAHIVILSVLTLFLVACSGGKTRTTCFECTTTPQKWSDFSFESLEGTWRGKQDFSHNEVTDKEQVTSRSKDVEVTFLEGRKFLKAYKISENSCTGFPAESVVLLNELWWDRTDKPKNNERAFEVFGRMEGDTVSYGRAFITRNQGGNTCQYIGNPKPITMNRLALPAVAYSRRLTSDGRMPASGGEAKEVGVELEFLNFDYAQVKDEYRWKGKEKEAPLFFRFVKTTRTVSSAYDDGDWQSTEERVFRLWRVQNPAAHASGSK